mmetsp:Transcript_9337/g.30941  ORF Transcript_9337/g.30941 Transcript_9337/m.30941 type:complete len:256 (+) Transcript_9337:381-1148(+)
MHSRCEPPSQRRVRTLSQRRVHVGRRRVCGARRGLGMRHPGVRRRMARVGRIGLAVVDVRRQVCPPVLIEQAPAVDGHPAVPRRVCAQPGGLVEQRGQVCALGLTLLEPVVEAGPDPLPVEVGHRHHLPAEGAELPPLENRGTGRLGVADEVRRAVHLHTDQHPSPLHREVDGVALWDADLLGHPQPERLERVLHRLLHARRTQPRRKKGPLRPLPQRRGKLRPVPDHLPGAGVGPGGECTGQSPGAPGRESRMD